MRAAIKQLRQHIHLMCVHLPNTERLFVAGASIISTSIYDKIIKHGLEAQAPLPCKSKRGRQARRTGHNLLLRLLHYKQDVLRFLHDLAIPFTNNDAERDLRMMKCEQKISGGFRPNPRVY